MSEHSLQVAMVAHALAAIKNRKFGGRSTPNVSLYWRCTTMPQSVYTGDLPTPVKYFNSQIAQEYKAIQKLLSKNWSNTWFRKSCGYLCAVN
ncbi:YfbR-like 5'-deoxynucleotidase [Shigella flexneri]